MKFNIHNKIKIVFLLFVILFFKPNCKSLGIETNLNCIDIKSYVGSLPDNLFLYFNDIDALKLQNQYNKELLMSGCIDTEKIIDIIIKAGRYDFIDSKAYHNFHKYLNIYIHNNINEIIQIFETKGSTEIYHFFMFYFIEFYVNEQVEHYIENINVFFIEQNINWNFRDVVRDDIKRSLNTIYLNINNDLAINMFNNLPDDLLFRFQDNDSTAGKSINYYYPIITNSNITAKTFVNKISTMGQYVIQHKHNELKWREEYSMFKAVLINYVLKNTIDIRKELLKLSDNQIYSFFYIFECTTELRRWSPTGKLISGVVPYWIKNSNSQRLQKIYEKILLL